MSIVVAITKGQRTVIAADTMGFYGSQRVPIENSRAVKVRPVGTAYLAMTGWSVYDNILDDMIKKNPKPSLNSTQEIFTFVMAMWHELHEHYPFVNDQSATKDSPFGDLDSTFMVANSNGIFKVASDTNVSKFEQYYAIGSGSDYAMGALHALYDSDLDAKALAQRAIATAIHFDCYCGGEIDLYSIDR